MRTPRRQDDSRSDSADDVPSEPVLDAPPPDTTALIVPELGKPGEGAPAAPSEEEVQQPVVEGPRLFTIEQWARGRHDPLTTAFVSTHRKPTVKKAAADWMAMYKAWLQEPR